MIVLRDNMKITDPEPIKWPKVGEYARAALIGAACGLAVGSVFALVALVMLGVI